VITLLIALAGTAQAQIHPECKGVDVPKDYNEQAQVDFLNNYFALGSQLSAIHGPIPHEAGHGAIGVDLAVLPPLSCERRLALEGTKTEDTNQSPILPRPRATVALPAIGKLVPYIGAAWLPPVKALGMTNLLLSAEGGVGIPVGESGFQLGGRMHATVHKTVGDVATAFDPKDDPVDDLFLASTFGFDLMAGYELGVPITPYLSAGLTDASTLFYVGDDGVMANNLHPYFGPVMAAGLDGLVAERFRWGAEFFGAPGGYATPPGVEVESVSPASRYGHMYTARFRMAVEL